MITDEYGNRRFFGIYRGVVQDNADPLGKGRLRLRIPQVLFEATTDWAWAKDAHGVHVDPPVVGQGVWVQFEGGDPSFPVWVGTFGDNPVEIDVPVGSLSFDDLTDVTITSPTTRQVPVYNDATGQWENGSVAIPSGGDAGQVLAKASDSDYLLSWVSGTQVPTSTVKHIVRNDSGGTLAKGTVVYTSGANGTHILVKPALATADQYSAQVVGFLETALANNADGYAISEGLLSNVNTSAAGDEGDPIWLSSTVAGGVIYGFANEPYAGKDGNPAHLVYLGVVTRKNANNGQIFVRISNGWEIDELHNVNINHANTRADKDILQYDYDTSLWKNTSLGNNSLYVGTTQIVLNRASASQSLTGITSIDGSAATLTTSRTLWGQSFDGSANVTGNLTSVGNITGSGAVTITAGGTNTNIVLAPNGTGTVDFSSKNITSVATITATTFSGALSGTATRATNIVGGDSTTLLGAIPYQSNTDITTLLSPNTTSTKKFLRQTGTGTNGAAPAWDTLVASDIPAALSSTTSVNGTTIPANTTLPLSQNYLINGGFDIWQRGTSFTNSANTAYTADRWNNVINAGGTQVISRQTTGVPDSSQYCLRVAMTGANSYSSKGQVIETSNTIPLLGKTVTFSVKLRCNASFSSNLTLAILKSSTVDGPPTAGVYSLIQNSSVSNASLPTGTTSTDWYTASVTATIPNDGTASSLLVRVAENTAQASGAYWEMAEAQLEIGSVATSFRRNSPSIQAELAACQRYYYRKNTGSTNGVFGSGYATATTTANVFVPFPVEMRTNPTTTLDWTGTNGNYRLIYANTAASLSATPTIQSTTLTPSGAVVAATVTSGLTQGQGLMLVSNLAGGSYLGFSAEL